MIPSPASDSTESRSLILVVVNATATNPGPFVTALVYAQTARALDQSVEIHLTGESVRLMSPGLAEELMTDPDTKTTLLDHIQRAVELEVRIYACSMAVRTYHKSQTFIKELTRQAGTTAVIGKMLTENARVLTF
jgi:predicted peroxiredoxin